MLKMPMTLMLMMMAIISMCWWRKTLILLLLSMELLLISIFMNMMMYLSSNHNPPLLLMLTIMVSGSSLGLALMVSSSRSQKTSHSSPTWSLMFDKINHSINNIIKIHSPLISNHPYFNNSYNNYYYKIFVH